MCFALVIATIFISAIFGGHSNVIQQERTFFGVLRVAERPDVRRTLEHGTTLHGMQSLQPWGANYPLTYYARSGPVGSIFGALQSPRPYGNVGVVGLGVGTLAAYGKPGQDFSYFDIDPAVISIARDERKFTFLSGSKASVRTVIGDGRLKLAKEGNGNYDLLVLDAFSSDSVPVHLITRESMAMYRQKVAADGVIAYHISSRHLRLEPVLARQAQALGLHGMANRDVKLSADEAQRGVTASHWVVMSRSPERLQALTGAAGWHTLRASPETPLWTDDFSNVLSVIDWTR